MTRRAAFGRMMGACAALLVLLLPGCITFDSETPATVTLWVTHDHGAETLRHDSVPILVGWSVMDALVAATDVELRYGGAFVSSIDGLRSEAPRHNIDWFYEVDGYLSDIGATALFLSGNESIHWDYRAWDHPADVAGHFNSFPWTAARVFTTTGNVSGSLAERAEFWSGQWPRTGPFTDDAGAILVATPETAPWDLLPGVTLDGEDLVVGEVRLTAPWAVTVRAHPINTVRAVMVQSGMLAPLPTTGLGLALNGTLEVEVRL